MESTNENDSCCHHLFYRGDYHCSFLRTARIQLDTKHGQRPRSTRAEKSMDHAGRLHRLWGTAQYWLCSKIHLRPKNLFSRFIDHALRAGDFAFGLFQHRTIYQGNKFLSAGKQVTFTFRISSGIRLHDRNFLQACHCPHIRRKMAARGLLSAGNGSLVPVWLERKWNSSDCKGDRSKDTIFGELYLAVS